MIPGRDVPLRKFLHALRGEWSRDAVGQVAGAVTFFGVLSLFPFLVFLIALASVIIDPTQAEALVAQLEKVAPAQVTGILGEQIRRLGQAQDRGLLTVSALTGRMVGLVAESGEVVVRSFEYRGHDDPDGL